MPPPGRSGPEPLPHDSWDSAVTVSRRAIGRHRAPRRYALLAAGLVVTALVAIAGIPFLLAGDPVEQAAVPTTGGPAGGTTPAPWGSTGMAVVLTAPADPTTLPAGDGTSGVPTAPAGTTASNGTTGPGGTPPPAGTAGPAAPLVLEAESVTVRLDRAHVVEVDGAAGGRAVRFTSRHGEIRFTSLNVPSSGRYRVTVVFAPGGSWSGSLRGSDGPERVRFGPGNGCCATVAGMVRLTPGGSLRIGLSHGQGPFPAIDLIAIEQA